MFPIAAAVPAIAAAFLASLVEVAEAFTIVLAVGLTRGWRPALLGAAAGLVVLALLIAILGPVIELVPLGLLQFAIGALLVLFGLRWLRKAILRAAGLLPLHDEQQAYDRETAALSKHSHDRQADLRAGLTAFNAVLLEGLEVVFIVVAVGAGRGMLVYASLGAAAAVVVILVIGIAVHRPLAQIPENALKFVVGLMLTSFGIFWTGEGLGVEWPGADWSLLGILAVFAALSFAAVGWLKPLRRGQLRVVK